MHLGGHGVPHGDVVALDEARPGDRVGALLLGGDDERPTGSDDAEDVVDGQVESGGGEGQGAVMLVDAKSGRDVHDGVVGGGVRNDDALRGARRARRVDEVGGHRRVCLLVDTCGVGDRGGSDGRGTEDRPSPVLGGVRPIRDDEVHFGELGDASAPSYRVGDVDGHVDGAGAQGPDEGGHELEAVGQADGHVVPGNCSGGADRGGVGGRAVEEVLMGPGPLAADDGHGVGSGPGAVDDRPLQPHRLAWDGGDPADGRIGFHWDGTAVGQSQKEVTHTAEGLLVPVPAQGPVANVPAHLELAVEFENLAVDEDLRGLGQASDGPASEARQGITVADTKHGGEDEGEECGRPSATAGDFADDLDTVDVVVVEVLPQLAVHPADNLLNAVRPARVYEYWDGGGEVADDVLEIIVQGERYERGDVEREARTAGPAGQGGAVDGEQQTCR